MIFFSIYLLTFFSQIDVFVQDLNTKQTDSIKIKCWIEN